MDFFSELYVLASLQLVCHHFGSYHFNIIHTIGWIVMNFLLTFTVPRGWNLETW